ncbi:MAG: hypothetical protein ABSC95_17190 [Acetobacteraceae bacterium]|jgi:hypothetical protein
MFSIAYVILPFSDTPPADAVRASLARFQRGRRGDLPESWLTFHDETEEFRQVYEAHHIFTEQDTGGLRIEGNVIDSSWFIDTGNIRAEMRLGGLRQWRVRFADTMDLDEFYERFGRKLERHPETGAFGRWLNPLGHWDWWDLGGRFDGHIIGDRRSGEGRSIAQVSSGPNRGRSILANVENRLAEALGQEPIPSLDVQTDQNIELVTTLLADARAGRENAYPGSLVLPPGAVEDSLRWLHDWPKLGPEAAFTWLGLPAEAGWAAIVTAAYARFEDHWAAGVAYHH